MNFRTTYILLGIVILALAALGVFVLTSSDKSTNPSVEGYLLRQFRAADVKPKDVNSVEIELPGQTPEKIAFAREDNKWVMVAPSKARADNSAVDNVVSEILNARTEKSADISTNPATHGLDNPPVKVTLKTADNRSAWMAFGNVTIGGDQAVVYVLTSDDDKKPQAAKRGDFFALFKTNAPKGATNAGQLVKGVNDFRPLKIIGDGVVGPLDQVVRSLSVRADKNQIALFREPGGHWKFRVPADYGEAASDAAPPNRQAKDGAGVSAASANSSTQSPTFNRPIGQGIIDAGDDLAKYGLAAANKPLQIDFSRSDGVKETMYVSGPIKKDAHEKYYARHEADSVVYEVPAEPVKKVLAVLSNKGALRDRTVLRLNPQRIDAIDIDVHGGKFELRKVGFGWQVFDSDGKGRPASSKAVNDLIGRLTAKQLASSFPPPGIPDDKMGFTKPSVEIKFWEGGIVPEKTEPGKKETPATKPKVSRHANRPARFWQSRSRRRGVCPPVRRRCQGRFLPAGRRLQTRLPRPARLHRRLAQAARPGQGASS